MLSKSEIERLVYVSHVAAERARADWRGPTAILRRLVVFGRHAWILQTATGYALGKGSRQIGFAEFETEIVRVGGHVLPRLAKNRCERPVVDGSSAAPRCTQDAGHEGDCSAPPLAPLPADLPVGSLPPGDAPAPTTLLGFPVVEDATLDPGTIEFGERLPGSPSVRLTGVGTPPADVEARAEAYGTLLGLPVERVAAEDAARVRLEARHEGKIEGVAVAVTAGPVGHEDLVSRRFVERLFAGRRGHGGTTGEQVVERHLSRREVEAIVRCAYAIGHDHGKKTGGRLGVLEARLDLGPAVTRALAVLEFVETLGAGKSLENMGNDVAKAKTSAAGAFAELRDDWKTLEQKGGKS